MKRRSLSCLLPMLSVAACASLPLRASSGVNEHSAAQDVIVGLNGNVLRFHGVPVNLTISDLKSLPYPVKMGQEMDEGDLYTVAMIKAKNGVEVRIVFDESGESGKLYLAETSSPNAIGPRGISVGSSLSDVKAAWPSGQLVYGLAHGKYVTFKTGTNLYYQFNPSEMPSQAFDDSFTKIEVPILKVQSIRIMAPAQ